MGVKLGGWEIVEKTEIKVLRMKFSIVENVPTSRDSIFKLSPASQRPSGEKKHKTLFVLFSI